MAYYVWNFIIGMLVYGTILDYPTHLNASKSKGTKGWNNSGNVASLIHVLLVLDYHKHTVMEQVKGLSSRNNAYYGFDKPLTISHQLFSCDPCGSC